MDGERDLRSVRVDGFIGQICAPCIVNLGAGKGQGHLDFVRPHYGSFGTSNGAWGHYMAVPPSRKLGL